MYLLVLWVEREGIHSAFLCVCIHWHFQITSFFSSKSGLYEAERKPRKLTAMMFLGFRSPYPVCLLLSAFQSLPIFVHISISRFIAHHFVMVHRYWLVFFPPKLKVCNNPVSNKSISDTFPKAFAHFVALITF